MSLALAKGHAAELREALLDNGVQRVSIELVAGRGGNVSPYLATTHTAMLSHHIVSRRSMGLTPGLALVKRGRKDLAGPLCNAYGGFDLTARIITMGWANHSGAGGPKAYQGRSIPRNNGRPYLFGWEFEGGLDARDWTDEFHEFMARCGAGTLEWLGRTEDSHDEHSGWAEGRKIDRLNYTTESGRQAIRAVLLTGKVHAPRPAPKPAPKPKAKYGAWYKGKPGSRVVRMYDTGEDVKVLQAWAGLPKSKQDGFCGPETVGEIKTEQRKAGLTVDGIAGKNTWAVVLKTATAGANTTLTSRTQGAVHLHKDGKWGADTDRGVKAVRAVAYLGRFLYGVAYTQARVGTKADSVWGPNSRSALERTVRLLQAAWGVEADGKWGPVTERAYQAARTRNYLKF